MTKEELEKEAEEKAKKRTKGFKCQDNCEKSYVMGALDFAEPREKRIAELEKACQDLSVKFDYQVKQVMKLEDENAELKEKLKPENCLKSLAKSGLVKFTCENGNEHDQLTKAKELLNMFLRLHYLPIVDEATLYHKVEQFLKDLEK